MVDQYYKDPCKYFEVSPPSAVEKTTTIAIATSNTSIEPAKLPEIKNNELHGVSDEYSLDTQNRDKSQQFPGVEIKSI